MPQRGENCAGAGMHPMAPETGAAFCLAVINKQDPPQQEAFLMRLESLLRGKPEP